MKKALLASSALVGAALLAAPASAGPVNSRMTSMEVTLGGTLWFSASMVDADVSTGRGRGYRFAVNETEAYINARNTADNGITYGVSLELNTGGADGTVGDEAFAFLSADSWGRLELGDQDDAVNRMQIGSQNAHKGLGGPLGGLGLNLTGFGGFGGEAMGARSDWSTVITNDATKVNYFSPRFSGFQLGASFTPDAGINSGTGGLTDTDNDGDRENLLSLGVNYTGKFDAASVGLSAVMLKGDDEQAAASGAVVAALNEEDVNVWNIGGRLDLNGVTLGMHYTDFGETGILTVNKDNGADAGHTWSAALGYQAGPWGISAWYTDHSKDNANTSAAGSESTNLDRMGLGAGYTVAPGWLLRADLEFISHDNASGGTGVGATTDNDARAFMLTNMFMF